MDKIKQGIQVVAKAVEYDTSNQLAFAYECYNTSISLFQTGLDELDPSSKNYALTKTKLVEYEARRDAIGRQLNQAGVGMSVGVSTTRTASTLKPQRGPSMHEVTPSTSTRRRSLSPGSKAAPAAARSHVEAMNEAKRVLNDAMKCDRSKDYDRALELYQTGLDLLLPLMKDSADAEEKKWITEQVRKHLTRAETLKRLIEEADEAKRPPTAQKMRWLADSEWDAVSLSV
jgi:hypothetical protein